MRQWLIGVLGAVPLDARGRRAVDETLIDWAHEAALAATPWQRRWAGVRGLTGLFRTVTKTVAFEIAHVPYGWLLARLLLIGGPLCLLLVFRPVVDQLSHVELASARITLGALLLPQAIPVVLPLALFWTVAHPPRGKDVPVLGLALLSCVTMLIVLGWGVPSANQRFRAMTFDLLMAARPVAGPVQLVRGITERSLIDLFIMLGGHEPARALTQLITMAGLSILTPALVVLGAAVSTLGLRWRRHATWLVPVAGIALMSVAGNLSFLLFACICMVAARRLTSRAQMPPPAPWGGVVV